MKLYRPTTNVFIIDKNKILCIDTGSFIAFPGGGLEDDEDPVLASSREIEEEIGYTNLKYKLIKHPVYHDYYLEWANQSSKNKDRYKKYKGEKTYFLIGRLTSKTKIVTPTDPLPNKPQWMNLNNVIEKIIKYGYKHKNEEVYKGAQVILLSSLLN